MTSHGDIYFGPYEVTKQVFFTTPHSFALVNLNPLIPGHVLVCPLAAHERLADLSARETADLFSTVQLTQRLLARIYLDDATAPSTGDQTRWRPAGSFTVAVQDGPEAGQTVPHVHVHVIPRTGRGTVDGVTGDALYERMAGEAGNVGGALWDRERRPVPGGGMGTVDDADRVARTAEQMHDEAERYRTTLREMGLVETAGSSAADEAVER